MASFLEGIISIFVFAFAFISPWSRDPLEKLLVPQLVKIFSTRL